MEDALKLLSGVPWGTLLTLACGYCGYYIANIGLRSHHKPVDVTFTVLVFGFFAAFVYEAWRRLIWNEILTASIAAFVAAALLGGVWSRFGRRVLSILLRKSSVSHLDDLPTAWKSLFRETTNSRVNSLTVTLTDGTVLRCLDLRQFGSELNGPVTLGDEGDLLMYVTEIKYPGETEFVERENVVDDDFGTMVTYIPKDQIARINLRRRKLQ